MRLSEKLNLFVLCAWLAPCALGAETVRLYRDTYGVPHAFGDSLAGAYFGAGYAMAEDLTNAEAGIYGASELALEVEGRKSEFYGPGANNENVSKDIEARHFGFYRDAQEGFSRLSPQVQLALRAYAAGIAQRYSEDKKPRPDWAIEVKPEHLAATFLAANFYQSAMEASPYELKEIGVPLRYPYLGSNAWAIAPSRAADGMTIHFAGPQTPFGDAQPEIHLEWPGGRVAGYGYGLFLDPGVGLNHAWGSTANWPDTSDVYRLRLSQDKPYCYWDALANGGKGEWVPMTPLQIRFEIRGSRPYVGRRWVTRHGPVLRFIEGQWAFVWRASGWRRIEFIEAAFQKQWAASAREAIAAADPPEAVSGNWTLADRKGDIVFLYNARVFGRQGDGPRREVLPGDDRWNDWADWAFGLSGQARLPLAINPACGFVTSNNEAPWFAAPSGEIAGREAWPAYLVPLEGWGSAATARGETARALIGSRARITLQEALAFPFDASAPRAKAWVEAYQTAWETAPRRPNLSAGATRVHQILGTWRGQAAADAPGMTAAFFLVRELKPWSDPAQAARAEDPPAPQSLDVEAYARALEAAAYRLKTDYGKLVVPWGEIHGFAENGQWQPLSGGTDYIPAIFQAHAGESAKADSIGGDNRIRCSAGSAHLAVTVFQGESTRRFTVNPSGQHNPKVHPNSPHCRDQRPLFAAGRFKPFWLSEAEVKANLTPHAGKPGYEFQAVRTLEVPDFSSRPSP